MGFSFFGKRPSAVRPAFTPSSGMAAVKANGSDNLSYMNQIKTYPVLTEQEERDLIVRWYEHGDKRAFDALIASHLRLVPKIAQKYSGYGIDVTDLISEGNLGLLHSVERFKPEKGFRFSTYARWWIKASILNFVLQTWSLIKVGNGANKKRLFFNLRRAKQNLHVDGQRYLSEQDIDVLAKRFGVSREDVVAMDQRLSANDVSLAQPIGHSNDGDSITMADTLADDKPTPEDALVAADDRAWRSEVLREAVAKLDSREREILTRRYMTERPVTLSKLATVYGLTAERVRQIEAKAIAKIRQYLRPKMRQPALVSGLAMFVAATEVYA